MYKYLSGIGAISIAIILSAFTMPKRAITSFHYIPANGSEAQYETATNWEVRATHPECVPPFNDVCILRIDDSQLAPYSGTPTQQLAQYLVDQGPGSTDYISASAAVVALTFSKKP